MVGEYAVAAVQLFVLLSLDRLAGQRGRGDVLSGGGQREFQGCEIDGAERRSVLPLTGFLVQVSAWRQTYRPEVAWTVVGLNAVEPDRDAQTVVERPYFLLGPPWVELRVWLSQSRLRLTWRCPFGDCAWKDRLSDGPHQLSTRVDKGERMPWDR